MGSTIIHSLRLFLFILQELDDALYPQWNYITVSNLLPLVSYAFSSGISSLGR